MLDWQSFMRLFYTEKVEAEADRRWREAKKKRKGKNAKKMKYMRQVAQEQLKEASGEVKQQVEEFRQKVFAGTLYEDDPEKQNEEILS